MNNLTIRQTEAQAPAPLPSRVDAALTAMLNGIEPAGLNVTIPAHLAPSPEQREYLGNRALVLDAWLSSAGPDRTAMEIAALFDCMSMRSGDETDLRAKIAMYVADLSDLPAFALSAACRDFRLGIVGDGKWVPTQGELRRRAMSVAESSIGERARIRRVLDAKVTHPPQVNEDRRAKALAFAKQVADEMRMRPDPLRPKEQRLPTRQEAEEWLARENAHPYCPELSDELRAKYGLSETQDERAA